MMGRTPLPFCIVAAAATTLSPSCRPTASRSEALPQPVTSALAGWTRAVEAFGPRMARDVRPVSVLVDLEVEEGEVSVGRIRYLASTIPASGGHWWITVDNHTLTLRLEERPATWVGPFPGRWIEMERVAVDVEGALAAGERYLAEGEGLGPDSSPDLQIDLVLSPGELRATGGTPEHDVVWRLSYDTWTSEGPQGSLGIEIDAETGDIIEVVDLR